MKVSTGQLARRYASALFESAVELGTVDKLSKEVNAVAALLASSDLAQFFASQTRTSAEKKQMLELIVEKLNLSGELNRTLLLMAQNNRLSHINLVMKKVLEKIDTHKNIIRGQIRSASPLSADEIARLEKAISPGDGATVVFECETDPQLRAGLLVKIGTRQVDATLKTRLSNLKEILSQGV
jgi:F-type H+-transporting ATPase subunit delta